MYKTTISLSHTIIIMTDAQQIKIKAGRSHVCPDREGTMKRKASSRVFEPTKKKHCKECLNTNLVEVKQVVSVVDRLLDNTCNQCGLLWADIPEDTRQQHRDEDIKSSAMVITGAIDAKIKSVRCAKKNLRASAYDLYYHDTEAEMEPTHYLGKAHELNAADMTLLNGTFMEGRDLDDRPSANFSAVPSCLTTEKGPVDFHLAVEREGMFSYIECFMKSEKSKHTTYQVDPLLLTDTWGADRYSCYLCLGDLKFDFSAEYDPEGVGCKVCSCSAHVDGQYPKADVPTLTPLPEAMLRLLNLPAPKGQTVVNRNEDNASFLYMCNSMFTGYVIHTNCCSL